MDCRNLAQSLEEIKRGSRAGVADSIFVSSNIGAANIIGKNASGPRPDKEVVPEEAIRPSTENQDYHVGRGGAGNEHHAPEEKNASGSTAPTGLADKLKAKIVGMFKK